MAEGDRDAEPRGDRRAGRRGGRAAAGSPPASAPALRRPARRRGRRPATRRSSWRWPMFAAAAAQAGLPAVAGHPGRGRSARTTTTTRTRTPMIRLGSLAATRSRARACWPAGRRRRVAAVYAIALQAGPGDQARAVRRDLRRPLRRPVHRAASRSATRGRLLGARGPASRWKLYICTYEVPGGLRSHREQIAQELIAVYQPGLQPASSTTRRGRTSGSASTTAPDRPAR